MTQEQYEQMLKEDFDAWADRYGNVEYIEDQKMAQGDTFNWPFLSSMRRHPLVL